MRRFFVPPTNIDNNKIIIDSEDVLHIKKVLRLNVSDKIVVCDSMGMDYFCEISEFLDKKIICTFDNFSKSDTEPNVFVTLYQGIPKGAKMEYIIQKTTELGISKIVPVALARSVCKIEKGKAEEKKTERWQKIAREAAKQSGRGVIPEICPIMSFSNAIQAMKNDDLTFVPYECEETTSIKEKLTGNNASKTASFLIGPEGGFDLSEIEQIKENNISTVSLGKRILRTETAGEAVLSMLMYEIGDIN